MPLMWSWAGFRQFSLKWLKGDNPPQLDFFGNLFSGFETLITLSVILRHLEAELRILRSLKLIRGVISTLKKIFKKKNSPQIHFWRKPCCAENPWVRWIKCSTFCKCFYLWFTQYKCTTDFSYYLFISPNVYHTFSVFSKSHESYAL
jgi:hypothetical protein